MNFGKFDSLMGKNEEPPLFKQFLVGPHDLLVDVGSDFHFNPEKQSLSGRGGKRPRNFLGDMIERNRGTRSKIVAVLGDVFDSPNGENTIGETREFLRLVSEIYSNVLFVAGNHDLRGRERPWEDFKDLPKNLIMPIGEKPVEETVNGTRILLANLFYDLRPEFKIFDNERFGFSDEEILQGYGELADGNYLFGGKLDGFAKYTDEVMKAFEQRQPDLLLTHTLPHPGPIFLKELTPENRKWNLKNAFQGTNVLGKLQLSRPLTAIHGHNHRSDDQRYIINGTPVRTLSHQHKLSSALKEGGGGLVAGTNGVA